MGSLQLRARMGLNMLPSSSTWIRKISLSQLRPGVSLGAECRVHAGTNPGVWTHNADAVLQSSHAHSHDNGALVCR